MDMVLHTTQPKLHLKYPCAQAYIRLCCGSATFASFLQAGHCCHQSAGWQAGSRRPPPFTHTRYPITPTEANVHSVGPRKCLKAEYLRG